MRYRLYYIAENIAHLQRFDSRESLGCELDDVTPHGYYYNDYDDPDWADDNIVAYVEAATGITGGWSYTAYSEPNPEFSS